LNHAIGGFAEPGLAGELRPSRGADNAWTGHIDSPREKFGSAVRAAVPDTARIRRNEIFTRLYAYFSGYLRPARKPCAKTARMLWIAKSIRIKKTVKTGLDMV
jgi:hypothetical protein